MASEQKKTPIWLLSVIIVGAIALGMVAGSLPSKGAPDCPEQPTVQPVRTGTPDHADPDGGKAKETPRFEGAPDAPSASTPEVSPSTGWTKTALDVGMIGIWEDSDRKQLEVKIDKPNPERKFKAQPPDFNIKFRIPTGSGLYEGGCDAYVSGRASCRIHDPADPATRLVGKKVEGIVEAEYTFRSGVGDMMRLNIPNGVVVELVRRPSKSDT